MGAGAMSKPIMEESFWRERLRQAKEFGELHRSVFHVTQAGWDEICERHRSELASTPPNASILDVGCGYGGLLDLLPATWRGEYVGVDISPDLIAEARRLHPDRKFVWHDMRWRWRLRTHYDIAIMRSMRQMIRGNMGEEVWEKIQKNIEAASTSQIYLEYGDK